MKTLRFLLYGLLLSWISACEEEIDSAALQVYKGPVKTVTSLHLVESDSALLRTEIKAPKQLEFLNGNLEFPEGVHIQFYAQDGSLQSTIEANKGYFDKTANRYRGEGNVQVHNIPENQSLRAEELFWDPNKKIIYTETFVTIKDKETLFNGTGLTADENFTNYTLKKVRDSRTILPGENL